MPKSCFWWRDLRQRVAILQRTSPQRRTFCLDIKTHREKLVPVPDYNTEEAEASKDS